MAALAGHDGKFKWTSDAAGAVPLISDATHNIFSWKLDYTADALETTDFSTTGWRSFVAGLRQWAGSAEAYIDGTNQIPVSDVGGSANLWLYYHVSDTILTHEIYKGTAIITGIHPSVGVEGIQSQTIDFQGTGTLVYSDV